MARTSSRRRSDITLGLTTMFEAGYGAHGLDTRLDDLRDA